MPYYVVADHRTGSIVLVVRGSISMRDIFTDLNAGAEKFEAEWLPPNSMVSATLCVCVCVVLLLLLFFFGGGGGVNPQDR